MCFVCGEVCVCVGLSRRRCDDVGEWTPDCERRGNVRRASRYIEPCSSEDLSNTDTTDSLMVVHAISTDSGDTTPNFGWSDTELSEFYEPVSQPILGTRWLTAWKC